MEPTENKEQLMVMNQMAKTLASINKNQESMNSTLASIDKNQAMMNSTLSIMRTDYTKIIFALIAVVAASLGLKFINTPWYVDVAVYLCELSGTFVLFQLISVWKRINLANKVLRIVLVAIMIFSSVVQTCVYHPVEEPAPSWFLLVINLMLIVLAICSLWAVWKKPEPKKIDKS